MKKNKKLSTFLITLGLILMVAAVLLTAFNLWDDFRASLASENALQQIKEARAQHKPGADPGQGDSSGAPYTGEDTEGDETDVFREMPTVEVDGYRYIGTITLLPLEIELPVMEEWDYTRMKISPCRYKGSVYTNDFIICGHNYKTHFGSIKNLQIDDEIIFTDVEGNSYRYKVVKQEVIDGYAVDEMTAGDWDLTLFTCTLARVTRVTVRCQRIDV